MWAYRSSPHEEENRRELVYVIYVMYHVSYVLSLVECASSRTLCVSSSAQVTCNIVYHSHWLVGEWIYSHKPLATRCNFSSCTCMIFVDTREIYLELNFGGSELRCPSDCCSRVVRKASEGNLETPHNCIPK